MNYKPAKAEKELFEAITSFETRDECQRFLRDLLTEAELKEFANRWKVAQMLDKKIAYKTIEKETGMSSTTIARIQKWLINGMEGYKNMLDKTKQGNKASAHHILI